MCLDCGCALSGPARIDGRASALPRLDLSRATTVVPLHADLLAPNNRDAAANRARWRALGLLTINVVSSPGAGKTTLLSRTIERLRPEHAAGLPLAELDLLIIENIGNLVCPADFDLGEDLRVTLLAVTEGEDKPLKYPPIYRNADVVLITKTDLAEACGFDRAAALASIRAINPRAEIIELSSRGGAGLDAWCALLRNRLAAVAA